MQKNRLKISKNFWEFGENFTKSGAKKQKIDQKWRKRFGKLMKIELNMWKIVIIDRKLGKNLLKIDQKS